MMEGYMLQRHGALNVSISHIKSLSVSVLPFQNKLFFHKATCLKL